MLFIQSVSAFWDPVSERKVKNTNICPKCQSKVIVRIPGSVQGDGNFIQAGWLSSIEVVRYMCGQCGYTEEWIDRPEDIKNLTNEYRPTPRSEK